jgi:VanZ family protein
MNSQLAQPMLGRILIWVCLGQFVIALFIYTALLLVPKPQIFVGPTFSDYALHAVGNILLSLSTWTASRGRLKAIGPFLFVMLFSTLMELAQGFTVNRTPDFLDIVANTVGAIVGYLLCMILDKTLKHRLF